MTDALDDSDLARNIFEPVVAFASGTGRALHRFILDIEEEQNIRRLQSAERKTRRKLMDPQVLVDGRKRYRILDTHTAQFTHLEVTHVSADAAARQIFDIVQASA